MNTKIQKTSPALFHHFRDVLSTQEILSALSREHCNFIQKVVYFDETDSTNTRAKQAAAQKPQELLDGTLFVADKQTAGKGRLGRSFDSPSGLGIFMTLVLKPVISPSKASMMTLIAGMAVCRMFQEFYAFDTHIKWPNDIVANGKKVCGILTEMSATPDCLHYIAIGIGINVNNSSFPKELSSVATSVFLETGKMEQRSLMIASVLKYFKYYYDIFLQTMDLSVLKQEYNSLMINTNKNVLVIHGNESFEAVAKYIDDDGELIVEQNGSLRKVMSGEVSVRGVYGYV